MASRNHNLVDTGAFVMPVSLTFVLNTREEQLVGQACQGGTP